MEPIKHETRIKFIVVYTIYLHILDTRTYIKLKVEISVSHLLETRIVCICDLGSISLSSWKVFPTKSISFLHLG